MTDRKTSPWFRTFRAKVFFGYGCVLCLMALMFTWSVFSLLALGQASDSILRENYKSIKAAEEMIDAIERQDSATLLAMLGGGAESSAEFKENETRFLQWLARAKDNITIVGEEEILAAIEKHYAQYLAVASVLFARPDPDLGRYRNEVETVFKKARDNCVRLREINEATMIEASDRAEKIANGAVRFSVISGGGALVLGIIFSLYLAGRLARPVADMRAAALRIAQGDYDVKLPEEGADELALLAARFNAMALSLKQYHEMNIDRILAEKLKSDAVIHSVDDGIVVVDPGRIIVNMNPMAGRIFGVAPQLALDRPFLDVIRDSRLFGLLDEVLKTGRPPVPDPARDVIGVPAGEATAYYQFSVAPIKVRTDSLFGVILMLRDITRLKELDRLKSEFVMTASHELRTPLTGIAMSLALLREKSFEKLGEKERVLLDAAEEEAGRLRALIDELLDLSRIETGRLTLEFRRTPAALLAEKAISLMKSQADHENVSLESELPENLPEIKADPNKLTWVLVNLIGNALRYTNNGGHVRVKTALSGNYVHLSVADDGVGIPEKDQARIFEKFVQLESSKTSGGSGLGLAICKEIVRAHGGVIWVESKVGQGSTFTFAVPVFGTDVKEKSHES
jgi:NtrC-family two-component system sensor histidine kinase KinB